MKSQIKNVLKAYKSMSVDLLQFVRLIIGVKQWSTLILVSSKTQSDWVYPEKFQFSSLQKKISCTLCKLLLNLTSIISRDLVLSLECRRLIVSNLTPDTSTSGKLTRDRDRLNMTFKHATKPLCIDLCLRQKARSVFSFINKK